MALFHVLANSVMQALQQQLGNGGKSSPCFHRTHGFRQHPDADAKHLLAANDAHAVNDLVKRNRSWNDRSNDGLYLFRLRQGTKEPGIEYSIKNARTGTQLFGKARCGSKNGGNEIKEIGVGLQHREELDTGWQARYETVKCEEGQIRIATAGKGRQHFQTCGFDGHGGAPCTAITPNVNEPAAGKNLKFSQHTFSNWDKLPI